MMKTYTVKGVATLSGISVRTLHHYDDVGLLKHGFELVEALGQHKERLIAEHGEGMRQSVETSKLHLAKMP